MVVIHGGVVKGSDAGIDGLANILYDLDTSKHKYKVVKVFKNKEALKKYKERLARRVEKYPLWNPQHSSERIVFRTIREGKNKGKVVALRRHIRYHAGGYPTKVSHIYPMGSGHGEKPYFGSKKGEPLLYGKRKPHSVLHKAKSFDLIL